MNEQLRATIINMKSLSQDIDDPIVAGGGEVNGMALRVIFSQEAKAHFSPETKVYLKWHHLGNDVRGYNVFKKVEEEPLTYEIYYPQELVREGDVLARIELVDRLSIAPSTSFRIHVLADPDSGTHFLASETYSAFQQATLNMNSLGEQVYALAANMQKKVEGFEAILESYGERISDVENAIHEQE